MENYLSRQSGQSLFFCKYVKYMDEINTHAHIHVNDKLRYMKAQLCP